MASGLPCIQLFMKVADLGRHPQALLHMPAAYDFSFYHICFVCHTQGVACCLPQATWRLTLRWEWTLLAWRWRMLSQKGAALLPCLAWPWLSPPTPPLPKGAALFWSHKLQREHWASPK